MMRFLPSTNETRAAKYYTACFHHAQQGQTRLQEEVGDWRGLLANRLGLSGAVTADDFLALCQNLRPGTDQHLTLRTKRRRRIGYDISFHVPRGFTLLSLLINKEELLPPFRMAYLNTMLDLQREVRGRIRKGGVKDKSRLTGNMVWAEFPHFTTRPVKGIAYPHIHVHNFGFNATWDPVEQLIKAADMADLKRHAPYYEAAFHARLAWCVLEMGYELQRNGKWWDIAGIPKPILDIFSPRTTVITAAQAKKGITTAKGKAKLAAMTREKKPTPLWMNSSRNG